MISQNGCVEYFEKPLELPNGETVLYKIEKINRPEGVEADVFENLLKEVEGEINWAILEKQNGGSLYPQYPHFYFDETLKDDENFRVMVSLFQMTPVEGKNIMLYPECQRDRSVASAYQTALKKKDDIAIALALSPFARKTAELVKSGAYEAAAGSCYAIFRCLAKTCKEHENWFCGFTGYDARGTGQWHQLKLRV